MQDIHIKTVNHVNQRYNTVGDYITNEDGSFEIIVSEFGDRKMEFLVALHELVESMLCRERGITEAEIDAFDMSFEEQRDKNNLSSEPGNDPDAPYHKEHMFTTKIEKLVADELGVDWDEYCQVCEEKTGSWLW